MNKKEKELETGVKCPKCGNKTDFCEYMTGCTNAHTFNFYSGMWNLTNDEIVDFKGECKLICNKCDHDCSDQHDSFNNYFRKKDDKQ